MGSSLYCLFMSLFPLSSFVFYHAQQSLPYVIGTRAFVHHLVVCTCIRTQGVYHNKDLWPLSLGGSQLNQWRRISLVSGRALFMDQCPSVTRTPSDSVPSAVVCGPLTSRLTFLQFITGPRAKPVDQMLRDDRLAIMPPYRCDWKTAGESARFSLSRPSRVVVATD